MQSPAGGARKQAPLPEGIEAENANEKRLQKKFVEDIKSLLRVLVMFLPVPMFWALYDQQGSIWLIQVCCLGFEVLGNSNGL